MQVGLVQEQVSVLVIADRLRIASSRIEPHEDVILVRSSYKHPVQWQRFPGVICAGFKRAELIFFRESQYENRQLGIVFQLRVRLLKYGPHALELGSDAATLFLV